MHQSSLIIFDYIILILILIMLYSGAVCSEKNY